MTTSRLRILGLAAAAVASVTPASAFTKCRTREGGYLFTDRPPPGCVVEAEIANAPEAPSGDDATADGAAAEDPPASGSVEAQAIRTRRRIERDLAAAAADLEALGRERLAAPRMPAGVYVNTRTGEGSYEDGRTIERRAEAAIREREETVKARIAALRDEYATVTAELREANGGAMPPWWSESPRCPRCP